jgi:hypothetical protein
MKKLILATILLVVANPAYAQENDTKVVVSAAVLCQPTSYVIKQLKKEGLVPFVTANGKINGVNTKTNKVIPIYGLTEVFMDLSAIGKFAFVLTVPANETSSVSMSCVISTGVDFKPHPQAVLKGDTRL